ncbi:gata transcription factor [Phlyctema vagabunda]|uniref:Gata transcription factor n=1 Tax=Phlyctema vagabunda TaxID=108571 RepID=A0ABR4PJY5_9HELO
MASPSGMANSLGQGPAPQSQPSPVPAEDDCDEDGVSVRPMRLKVLYTFDDQNKTNCLARWPDVLQIKTVAMDETTSIGVIELKTCIRAIVQCSPELVARLGQDYTVYAYDYSEYDIPLVGQGMLSWALAASSPTPTAPASQSRQLITGRVCKNIPGIFSNGIKETLEVKLRLVPVPTVLQSEYISNMEKYREISKVVPPGFDHSEWTAFLQSNPNITQLASKMSAPTPPTSNQRDGVSMEVINQLLSPNIQPQAMESTSQTQNPETQSIDSQNGGKTQKTSRPASRTTAKRPYKRRQKAPAATGGNTSGYEEGTDADERPAPRKRAKKNTPATEEGVTDVEEGAGRKKRATITKANWTRKDTIGSTSDSLRVAASTAGSIRLFRPIAMSPTVDSNGQDIPRAPTPVPSLSNQRAGPMRGASNLRRNSNLSQNDSQPLLSPNPPLLPAANEEQLIESIEQTNASPNPSLFGTPPEIGSSPPVMRGATPLISSPQCPSSPELPQMPRTDSGFMSGTLDDLIGEEEVTRPVVVSKSGIDEASKNKRRKPVEVHHGFAIQEETPGPVEFLPTRMLRNSPPPGPGPMHYVAPRPGTDTSIFEDGQTLPPLPLGKYDPSPAMENSLFSASFENDELPPPDQLLPGPVIQLSTVQTRPMPRTMIRTASTGSLNLPTGPASDPLLPPSGLHRSHTWSQAPHPMTEVLPSIESGTASDSFRSQSVEQAAKKSLTRKRLELAIEKGQMPPFCSNCGSIDTPTWRKAFAKEIEGVPPYYDYSDGPGKVTAIDILARDLQGKPTSYRLIKKSLAKSDNKGEFKEIALCNPCGIWMSKYKSQRPEEQYIKSIKEAPPKRIRKKKNRSTAAPTSEAYYPMSEGYFPQSDFQHPPSESNFVPQMSFTGTPSVSEPQPQISHDYGQRRASFSQESKRIIKPMTSDVASAALERAIQSSPARWMGTRNSPINVDDDFGSTRRTLFPSPAKSAGVPSTASEVHTQVTTVAVELESLKAVVESANKENCPPTLDIEEDPEILALFEEDMARPKTPEQKTPQQNPFKTPTRPTPSHRPVTRSVSKSNRSVRSPSQLLLMAQKTPTRTPRSVRRSPRNHQPSIFDSPFTATLNQLMMGSNDHTFSPSRHLDVEYGTLPPLEVSNTVHANFSHLPAFDSDFFSTDVPMPSSPPRMFNLYEDHNLDHIWNMDFDARSNDLDLGTVLDKHGDPVYVKPDPDAEEDVSTLISNDTTPKESEN